ncbi:MAG: hypothetical protein RQM92_00485 [Candidatus Syntrophopropionicum ammoniitolerans]
MTKNIAPENVAVGDVISFRVENDIMVSHRVTEIQTAGGLSFLTKGDANIGMDAVNVRPETIEGLYIWRGRPGEIRHIPANPHRHVDICDHPPVLVYHLRHRLPWAGAARKKAPGKQLWKPSWQR